MKQDLIRQLFFQRIGEFPEHIITSPGRINLIGEHIDYSGGHVLPASIDRYIYIGISKAEDDEIIAEAIDLQERFEATIDDLDEAESHWELCLKGAINLTKDLAHLGGFSMVIVSDLPVGSGLSSSSALCCGILAALSKTFELNLSRNKIAEFARIIESQYIGVSCGFMDQFIISHGQKDKAAFLNCKTMEYSWVNVQIPGHRFVLLNSNVPRQLMNSEYNQRRKTCDEVLGILNSGQDEFDYLCDIKEDLFENKEDLLTPTQRKRAGFAIKENQRVFKFKKSLENGNTEVLGRLLYESQEGLSNQYEVSCSEIDYLIEGLRLIPEIKGARMIGGGFGGCILCLVKDSFVQEVLADLQTGYQESFGHELEIVEFEIAPGIEIL